MYFPRGPLREVLTAPSQNYDRGWFVRKPLRTGEVLRQRYGQGDSVGEQLHRHRHRHVRTSQLSDSTSPFVRTYLQVCNAPKAVARR